MNLVSSYQFSETVGANLTNSTGTNVTGGGGGTKGSYQDVGTPTQYPSDAIMVLHRNYDTTSFRDILMDVSINVGGTRQIILPDLGITGRYRTIGGEYFFPIQIPQGSQLSVRTQQFTNSMVSVVEFVLFRKPVYKNVPKFSKVTAYGISYNAGTGTIAIAVEPGGSANTKGAWSVIGTTSSYTRMISMGIFHRGNAIMADANWFFDIAVGPTGSEQVVASNLIYISNTAEQGFPRTHSFLVDIPAGTQLNVRSQCTITDATDRLLDVAIYGVS